MLNNRIYVFLIG
ncbi:putative membrane protein, partial [Chlamydia psittaci 06-1683]